MLMNDGDFFLLAIVTLANTEIAHGFFLSIEGLGEMGSLSTYPGVSLFFRPADCRKFRRFRSHSSR